MRKIPKVGQALLIYTALPALQKALGLILIPLYTHHISPAEYGAWAFIVTVTTLIRLVSTLGLDSAFSYSVRVRKGWTNDPDAIRANSYRSSLLLELIGYCIAYPILVRYPLGIAEIRALWLIGFLDAWLGHTESTILSKLQMQEKPFRYAMFAGFDLLVTPLSAYFMVVKLDMGIYGLAWAQFVSPAALLIPLLRQMKEEWKAPFSWPAIREALRFSSPLIFHELAGWGLAVLDRIMLQRMASLKELGIYTLAAQTSSAVSFIMVAANKAYLPFFLRNHDKDPRKVRLAQIGMGSIAILVGLSWSCVLPILFKYFIDPDYQPAMKSSFVLVMGNVAYGFYYIGVNYLFLWKETKTIALCTTTAFLSNFLLNLILIPRYQNLGAAWATFISYIVFTSMVFIFVRLKSKQRQKATL